MATKVGSEILVNTGVEQNQTSPDVVRLSDGRILIVWDDDETESARGQLFSATGARIGGEIALTEEFEERPIVAALSDGFIVVTGDDTPTRPLIAQRYDAQGAQIGGEIVLQTRVGENNVFLFDAAELDGGGVAIAWYYNDPFGSGRLLKVQTFDAAGAATSDAQQVNAAANSFVSDVDVIALPGGGFQVVYVETPEIGGDNDVFGRRYGADFAPLTPAGVQLNATDEGLQTVADAARLADGGSVVVWYSAGTGAAGTAGIFGQRFDAAGAPVGGEFKVSTGTAAGSPTATGLDTGGFVVAWIGFFDVPGVADSGIFLREYGADGAALGGEAVVNTTVEGGQSEPALAALDGGFVVTWQDNSRSGGDTSQGAIRAQFYSTRTPDAAATDGDNLLQGTVGPDVIDGLGGDDEIAGAEGDDRLSGGAGDDRLEGGPGADILSGGPGGDRLDGGEGQDFADFREPSAEAGVVVTLTGGTGATVTIGGVAADIVVNIEHVHGGAGNDVLSGDEAGNALFGHGGDDVLRGGGGRDYLYGDEGFDIADYGDRADAVAVRLAGQSTTVTLRSGGVAEDYVRGIEGVYGGAGDDLLTGDEGDNLFRGGGGADRLYGGGGSDTADYSDKTAGVRVTLAGGAASTVFVGGVAEDVLKLIENVNGGSGADVLLGDGRANTLRGGLGGDALRGGGGADRLEGGAGADAFVWGAVGESAAASGDSVLDFVSGADRLDLSRIDADATAAGNQAFVLGALQASAAGRLQVAVDGAGGWLVQGDVDGDGVADLAILVLGAVAPGTAAGDFAL